jgi:exosome complex component RRP42
MKEGNYAYELLLKDQRIDGRSFEDFRKIELQTGVIKTAEGSAQIKMGETEIIAGVKMNIGTPFPDTPNEGILIVNTEFTPLASPEFEAGPPSEDAIELARVVDRGIRESQCIDMEKLFIEPEKVWSVFIDIHIINHGGNLIDAAAIAAVSALHNAQIPKIDGTKILRGDYQAKLPVNHKPITVTICKVGDKIFVDPVLDE